MSERIPRHSGRGNPKEDEAKLRRLCDGTRTVKEVAARMGWSYLRTGEHIRKLGLKTAKDYGL